MMQGMPALLFTLKHQSEIEHATDLSIPHRQRLLDFVLLVICSPKAAKSTETHNQL